MKTAINQAIDIVKSLAGEEVHIIARITALVDTEKDQMRNMWKNGFNNDTMDTETGESRFEKEYRDKYGKKSNRT